MTGRLTLVTHAPTAATSRAAFACDEGVEPRGSRPVGCGASRGRCARPRAPPSRPPRRWASTRRPTRGWPTGTSARGAGAPSTRSPPSLPTLWRPGSTDPDAAPHGGETLTALLARVAAWLAGATTAGHTVAVTHAAVVRAAVVATLGAPAVGFWRIDVAPLTATVLRGGPARWTVRGTALPL